MKPLASLAMSLFILIGGTTVHGQNWTSNSIPFSPFSFSMSADGSVILVGAYYDGGYVSTNSGATWTNSLHTLYVSAPACSADGKKLFLAVQDFTNRLTCSTNFGVSWFTVTTNFPSMSFIACSADGNTLVGGGYSGLFTSTNAGANWRTNFSGTWNSASSSADGRSWIAGPSGNFGLVTSTNFGITWRSNNLPSSGWPSVVSSWDGNTLLAANHPNLYVSTNGGANWRINALPDPYNTPRFAASADLHKLVSYLSPSIGRIYTSTNLGVTWISNNVPIENWLQAGSTADGNRFIAFLNDSMWVSTDNIPPHLNVSHAEQAIKLSWVVPSTNFVAEENFEIDSTNWLALTNAASVNFSNLNLEMSVEPTESHPHAYFRLAHH